MYSFVATPTRTSVGTVFRSMAEKKVRAAGYDPARLPPGQYITAKWPVLHAGDVPRVDVATWTFRVYGEVEHEVELDWKAFNELPRSSNVQDIHCVTRWSRFDTAFEGVHWRELAKLCNPKASGHFVIAHAEHDFTANVPLASLEDEQALLATHANGEPLALEHGGPMRLVIPGKYFWKSAKWLRAIELSPIDRLGFWERYGYHNDADPWKEERYSF
jgi:DMSO/TMAO reductase YedYZ molybdopterin-dependent catalytic subunit